MNAFDKLMEAREWVRNLKDMKRNAIACKVSPDVLNIFDEAIELVNDSIAELEAEADKEADEEEKLMNQQYERMVF